MPAVAAMAASVPAAAMATTMTAAAVMLSKRFRRQRERGAQRDDQR
jgi:hypothetical protein